MTTYLVPAVTVALCAAAVLSADRPPNIVVVFTSDNGPWLPYGIDGGSAGPLRGGKGSVFEGGVRVPGIFWWPERIPAGRRASQIASNYDLAQDVSERTDRINDYPEDAKRLQHCTSVFSGVIGQYSSDR